MLLIQQWKNDQTFIRSENKTSLQTCIDVVFAGKVVTGNPYE